MRFDINSEDKAEHEKALLMKFQKETLVDIFYYCVINSGRSIPWEEFKITNEFIRLKNRADKCIRISKIMDELYSEPLPKKARAKVLSTELKKLMPIKKVRKRRDNNGS